MFSRARYRQPGGRQKAAVFLDQKPMDVLLREAGGDERPGLPAQPMPEVRIENQPANGGCERTRIARRHQQARLAIDDGIHTPGDPSRHDRDFHGATLQWDIRETLTKRGQDTDVDGGIYRGHVVNKPTRDVDPRILLQSRNDVTRDRVMWFKAPAQEKAKVCKVCRQQMPGLGQYFDSLVPDKPANKADDHSPVGHSPGGPYFRARLGFPLCGTEALQVDAMTGTVAKNRGLFIWTEAQRHHLGSERRTHT